MGAHHTPEATTFTVYAEADAVHLQLLNLGTRQARTVQLHPLSDHPGTFSATVEGDWNRWAYSYQIQREARTLSDIIDPWARLIRRGRGFVIAPSRERPTPRPALKPSRAIIYELHLQDFTRDPDAGIRPAWRGKYLGLAQPGTTLEDTRIATGLDHIIELGANVVQLMPIHAFAMPYDPDYEWGYMPLHFNAPEEHYASGTELEAPITELKRLVSMLHERGLRITLDVVYNHTAERPSDNLHALMAMAPKAYFRWKEDGTPWNGSGTGNEFRSDSPQGRRFIIDSCKYWVTEFGIDGFRFDLMGLIDQETMTQLTAELHAIDPTILIYGEPWTGGPSPVRTNAKGDQRSRGWSVFNDDFRDALRGEVFDEHDRGFLSSGSGIPETKPQLLGGVYTFADRPIESINYIECHDNHTLADRLRLTTREPHAASASMRDRMHRLGILMLMCAPGLPFLHTGQEWARSKNMEDNTYNLGNEINNLRWREKADRLDLHNFHREAIRLRLDHPIFRPETAEQVKQHFKMLDDDMGIALPPGAIAMHITDWSGRDPWQRALCLYNGSSQDATITIPDAHWLVVTTDGAFADPAHPLPTATGSHRLLAHSGAILVERRLV
ncbi:MAG: alpha-amylase family glycosyl hydrolase [Phycisphaerales bacterium]